MPTSPQFERFARLALMVLEGLMMGLLALVVLFALGGLAVQLAGALGPPFLAGAKLAAVLDDVLAVFVLIELLATAVAYVRGRDVMRSIFETVFVAIARKLITLDFSSHAAEQALWSAIQLIAAALAWWLVARAVHAPGAGPGPHEPLAAPAGPDEVAPQ